MHHGLVQFSAALKSTWLSLAAGRVALQGLRHGGLTSKYIGRLYSEGPHPSTNQSDIERHSMTTVKGHTPDAGRISHRPERLLILNGGEPRSFTLDPRKLTSDQFLDLSAIGRGTVRITFKRSKWGGHPESKRGRRRELSLTALTRYRGFLYYHLPPNAPALAGEIRFRLVESPDPSLFPSSPDLVGEDGLPWRLPLINLIRPIAPRRPKQEPLLSVLLADGLVSEELVRLGSQLLSRKQTILRRDSRIIYAFQQPVLVPLNCMRTAFWFVGEDRLENAYAFFPPAMDGRRRTSLYSKGSALCCFEKSTLPEHKGKRVVVLRVLRILEPVTVNPSVKHDMCPSNWTSIHTLEPRDGELLRRTVLGKSVLWRINVDQANTKLKKALRMLYDNEAQGRSA